MRIVRQSTPIAMFCLGFLRSSPGISAFLNINFEVSKKTFGACVGRPAIGLWVAWQAALCADPTYRRIHRCPPLVRHGRLGSGPNRRLRFNAKK